MTRTTLNQTALRVMGASFERISALVQEWWTRRKIKRSLGNLSDFLLRDVGLTKADIETACSDRFDRCASGALKGVAQNCASNW
jgi:uncharacterized protein YjiS (DUF1127 family)